jgi:hypothetical protein
MMDLNGAQRGRAPTWVRNNIVGLVALFVALSGTTYAAQAINDQGARGTKAAKKKKKVKRGPAGPQGPAGPAATDALTLGGLPASSYQQGCSAGAIWGFASIDTTGATPDFSNVPGFNCRGGAVQLRRNNVGDYQVRFVGSITAFALATISDPNPNLSKQVWVRNDAPGEFKVEVEDSGGTNRDDAAFTIVAF